MSRIAKAPVDLPQGVTATIAANAVTIKGAKGTLSLPLGERRLGGAEREEARRSSTRASARPAPTPAPRVRTWPTWSLGVTKGYEKKLELQGVGFRAAVHGKALNLTLGFSHPVSVAIPEGLSIETPSQTEILIKGIDRQKVGQLAAEIRDIRPPEPYKGKGVRYAGEKITLKEGKKK